MTYNPNCTSSFSFVSGMVGLYYQSGHDVQEDLELQAWIRDMSQQGFADLPNFGLLFISCFGFLLYLNIQVKCFFGLFFTKIFNLNFTIKYSDGLCDKI